MSNAKPQWTIAELGAAAERVLADGIEQKNGQVREVPDPRTIRYYASLGLVDKPAEVRGRTAYYGRRHLLQLVAVKRLQAAGKSLVEVQEALIGLGDAALEKLANVPPDAGPPPDEPRRPAAFWATPPAPVASVRTVQIVRLSSDLSLQLERGEPPTAEELTAIRTAAGPLLKLLDSHRSPHPEAP